MNASVLAEKNDHAFCLFKKSVIFLVFFGCFFSLVRSGFVYTNQYFIVSKWELDSDSVACLLSLLLAVVGYYVLPVWGRARVLKLGVLLTVGGLLSAAIGSQSTTFLFSAVVLSGGLAFSMPALVSLVKESMQLLPSLMTVIYALSIIGIASSLGLWMVVTSYYGFKELCCGLAVLLIMGVIRLKSGDVGSLA